ncbi:MAG: toll/interleukin-1 receptor domain-containing protein [Polyangiaceae bacterium]
MEIATETDLTRLWGDGTPKIFLSHKSEYKHETKALKDELAFFGAAAFVAHDDISPNRAWQVEIERALASMDALIALVTDDFCESPWTNQEIGVAIGRGIPVVSVRIDADPPGFAGAKQAVPGTGRDAKKIAEELVISMEAYPGLEAALREGLVREWERSNDFGTTTRLMTILGKYRAFPSELTGRLESAFKTNPQINQLNGISGRFETFLRNVKR